MLGFPHAGSQPTTRPALRIRISAGRSVGNRFILAPMGLKEIVIQIDAAIAQFYGTMERKIRLSADAPGWF